jgi:pyridoxal 5'-phosphate synthase pdxS subunit
MMHLGSEGVFIGSGVFKSTNPGATARAVVRAVTHYKDPEILAEVSHDLGEPMRGIEMSTLRPEEILATRGW